MSILGNILWFVCGGLLSGLAWVLSGCLWCITIIGIPIGLQCFKFASLAFFPFGKEVVYGGGAVSLLANIVWLIVSGIPMAVGNALLDMYNEVQSELAVKNEAAHNAPVVKLAAKPKAVAKVKDSMFCPQCGEPLTFEGGCNICKSCGWSKCY